MTFQKKHGDIESNENVMRWYRNIANGARTTADVYLRTLALYLKMNAKTPESVIEDARSGKLRFDFMDFRDRLLSEGKAGSYVIRFKKVLNSWVSFNGLDSNLSGVKIAGSELSPTLENESKPQKDEINALIRNASVRGRAIIGLLAFSGLRPESLGNYDGSDGIRIKDIEGLEIGPEGVRFTILPAQLRIRQSKVQLSKKGHAYFTFIPEQSANYIRDYLNIRIREGEKIGPDSPVIAKDPRGKNAKDSPFLSTLFLERDVRYAIKHAGLPFRPYILRVYWASCMDTAEAKGKVSHNWREFWMGHVGDISARYSTNKVLDADTINDMREAYRACQKYLLTDSTGISEDEIAERLSDTEKRMTERYLLLLGFSKDEIERGKLLEKDDEELQKAIQGRIRGMTEQRKTSVTIPSSELDRYLNNGYDLITIFPDGTRAVVKGMGMH